LADRLAVSEAIEAVTRMIKGYANRGTADKGYIGAIAELLMHYPKSVAIACADPFNGVVRDTKFMPTPSDVIGWCEKRVHPLYEEADREDRVVAQLDARDAWLNEKPSEQLKAAGLAWLDRSDPIAAELTSHNAKQNADRKAAGLEQIQKANQSLLDRRTRHETLTRRTSQNPTAAHEPH
jgi:hypothetical protein